MESVITHGIRKSRKKASAEDKNETKASYLPLSCHHVTITGTDIP